MASLISINGEIQNIDHMLVGGEMKLKDLQTLVAGSIELVPLSGGRFMCINEEGKLIGKKINEVATMICRCEGSIPDYDFIVGTAVVLEAGEIS